MNVWYGINGEWSWNGEKKSRINIFYYIEVASCLPHYAACTSSYVVLNTYLHNLRPPRRKAYITLSKLLFIAAAAGSFYERWFPDSTSLFYWPNGPKPTDVVTYHLLSITTIVSHFWYESVQIKSNDSIFTLMLIIIIIMLHNAHRLACLRRPIAISPDTDMYIRVLIETKLSRLSDVSQSNASKERTKNYSRIFLR